MGDVSDVLNSTIDQAKQSTSTALLMGLGILFLVGIVVFHEPRRR